MIRNLVSALLVGVLGSVSASADFAQYDYGRNVSSHLQADIVYWVTDHPAARKWWFGRCFGDSTPSYDRIKLFKTDKKHEASVYVSITPNKRDADRIFCIK